MDSRLPSPIRIQHSTAFSWSPTSSKIDCTSSTCTISYLTSRPSARAVYFRAPPIIQEDPEIKVIKSVVKAAWNRDYATFYALITEAETGSVNLDAVLVSLLQSYRCMFFSCLVVDRAVTWQARTLVLLSKAYTSIPPAKVGEYLGLSNDLLEYQQSKLGLSNDALVVDGIYKGWPRLIIVLGREWVYDTNKNLLSPPKSESGPSSTLLTNE